MNRRRPFGPLLASKHNGLAARVDGLLRTLPTAADDLIEPHALAAMTRIGTAQADSVHQLVMDMHKQLNTMQAEVADEYVDGAATYGLTDADRMLVSAFMRGVNRTAKLKFSHPGLATTATRGTDQLVIQNDLGTTDAHVIVIHAKQLAVTAGARRTPRSSPGNWERYVWWVVRRLTSTSTIAHASSVMLD